MNDRTKKILIWGSVITLVGVSGYLGYRFFNKRKKAKAEEEAKKLAEMQALIAQQQQQNQGGGGGGNQGGGGGGGGSRDFTFPFTTETEGNAFRAWVNDKYPDYAKSIKLDPTGSLNSYVQKAWEKYGEEYKKATATVVKPDKPTISESLKKDIDTIIAMGTGNKANRTYLEGGISEQKKKDWVSAWADALRANKADPSKGTTFSWKSGGRDYGLYEAYSGKKLMDFNPKDKNPKPLSEAYFYETPEVSNWSFVQATGSKTGTVKGYQWNNKTQKLWLYIPIPYDSYVSDPYIMGTKWIQASEVKF